MAQQLTPDGNHLWWMSNSYPDPPWGEIRSYLATHGQNFASPQEAFTVMQMLLPGAIPDNPPYTVEGGFASGRFTHIPNTIFNFDWTVLYGGNNLGQICPDGTYVEGGIPCPCQCSPIGKSLGNLCKVGMCGRGDPINVDTGNLFEEITDYVSGGSIPLTFVRFYNSLDDATTPEGIFGRHWRSDFERSLVLPPVESPDGPVKAYRGDGQILALNSRLTFRDRQPVFYWLGDTDTSIRVDRNETSCTLTNEDDSVETYEMVDAINARLISIRMREGYQQTFAYDNGKLISVTDSFGRALRFSYQGNRLRTLTTPGGLVVTYGFTQGTPNSENRLTSVTYSTTPPTGLTYLYENPAMPFALTGVINENGNRSASWTYDALGRALSSALGGGVGKTSVFYNDADGTRSVTNSLGAVEVIHFATMQGVRKIIRIDRLATDTTVAASRAFGYDNNGFLANQYDWNTNITEFKNDNRGLATAINEAIGAPVARNTVIENHATFRLPIKSIRPGKTQSLNYDGNAHLTNRTEIDTRADATAYSTAGKTRSTQFNIDTYGRVLSVLGPRTDVAAIQTNQYAGANLLSITDEEGHTIRFPSYNGSGNPTELLDANGLSTSLAYDIRERLQTRVAHSSAGDATNAFTYTPAGKVQSETSPLGTKVFYGFDSAERLIAVTNTLNETIHFELDADGNRIREETRSSHDTLVKLVRREFNALSQQTKTLGASGQSILVGLDANGNVLTTTDGRGLTSTQAVDGLNRLFLTTDPLKGVIKKEFDSNDDTVSITDPRSLKTRYVRDGWGRIIQEISPDRGVTTYWLDEAGNRIKEMDARGVVTLRTFDKRNRILSQTYPASPAENIVYHYDSTENGNKGIGRLTRVTDETGETRYFYDDRGNVNRMDATIGGHAYSTVYGYDLDNHVVQLIYPSGDSIFFERDIEGRVTNVTFLSQGTKTPVTLADDVRYLPFGPLKGLTFGNGIELRKAFDLAYRVTNIVSGSSQNPIQNLVFGYDDANNITAIIDKLDSRRSQWFGYDGNNRLTNAVGVYGALIYGYDHNGNRLQSSSNGVVEVYSYADTSNQLLSTTKLGEARTLQYTENGNVTVEASASNGNREFGYNNQNRFDMLTVNGLVKASYQYRFSGQRAVKMVSAEATHFHYDLNNHLIAETKSDGATIREYVWIDDLPTAQIEADGTIYFMHCDHLPAPQKMTDISGQIVFDQLQLPFGESYSVSTPSISISLATPTLNRSQFQFQVLTSPDLRYVIQSSDRVAASDWNDVSTNVGSQTLTLNVSDFRRYFRAISASSTPGDRMTQNLRFPGQYFDVESDLHYNFMRSYHNALGRYGQFDSIGLLGGINGYVYALNNPVSNIDPSGMDPIFDAYDFVFNRHFERENASIEYDRVNSQVTQLYAATLNPDQEVFVSRLNNGVKATLVRVPAAVNLGWRVAADSCVQAIQKTRRIEKLLWTE